VKRVTEVSSSPTVKREEYTTRVYTPVRTLVYTTPVHTLGIPLLLYTLGIPPWLYTLVYLPGYTPWLYTLVCLPYTPGYASLIHPAGLSTLMLIMSLPWAWAGSSPSPVSLLADVRT